MFTFDESMVGESSNIMDQWIISFTQSLLSFMHQEMGAYRLYTVTSCLIKFVDNLTNWYVRLNRRRLRGEAGREECLRALETLCSVLLCMVRIMAPFTPFITETMYQNLRRVVKPGTLGEVRIICDVLYCTVIGLFISYCMYYRLMTGKLYYNTVFHVHRETLNLCTTSLYPIQWRSSYAGTLRGV